MKRYELRDRMLNRIKEVGKEARKEILNNFDKFYIYENREFLLISELEEKEITQIRLELENENIARVFFDQNSKDAVDKNGANINATECNGAVVMNSSITGGLHMLYNNIYIFNSKISGNKSRILHNVLIENGSFVIDSAFSFVHLDGATALDSNLNFASVGKRSLINSYSFLANGIDMREDVMVGPNCNLIISTYEYHRPLEYYATNYEAEEDVLVINDQAWFGAGVNVVKGVDIGAWTIMAAGQTISDDVAPFSLAIGKDRKSIIDRVRKIKDDEEYFMRVLKREYPGNSGEDIAFKRLYEKLKQREDSDIILRLFYLYLNTDFITYNKKVNIHGNQFVFELKEKYFEFASPDNVIIDTNYKSMKIIFNDYYEEIAELRKEIVQMMCKFGYVKEIEKSVYEIELSDEIIEKILEIDNMFDNTIYETIEIFGMDISTCEIELKKITEYLIRS